MPLFAGDKLGPYEILAPLGAGGMGEVYRARDTNLGREVAIKLLADSLAQDSDHRARLRREAQILASLSHPNIAAVYGWEDGGDQPALVMELVPGRPLRDLIGRNGLPLAEALKYAIAMARGIESAHRAGIVHRDLKPSNVMVTPAGELKLLDFGLAKLVDLSTGDADAAETLTHGKTVEGQIVGTVAYMSPEQAQGKPLDTRSDIFSFGTVFYEMLTGKQPFRGEDNLSTLAAILRDEPKPAAEDSSTVLPREAERILALCLRKDPERRFQTAADLRVALEDLREELSSGRLELPAAPPSAGARLPQWIWALTAAAVLLSAASVSIWMLTQHGGVAHQLKQLTFESGMAVMPALSPDGKLLAYVSDHAGEGHPDLWLKQMAGGEAIRRTFEEAAVSDPQFSPDGTTIYYNRSDGIYAVPTLGGPSRMLVDGAGPFSVSSRGDIVFSRPGTGGTPGPVSIVTIDGGERQSWHPECRSSSAPAWSPDGQRVLIIGVCNGEFGRGGELGLFVAPRQRGSLYQINRVGYANMWSRPVWFRPANGSDSVLLPMRNGDSVNLYRITFDGKTTSVTQGTGWETSPAVAPTGALVFVRSEITPTIWSLPVSSNGNDTPRKESAPGLTFGVDREGNKLVFGRMAGIDQGQLVLKDRATGAETNLAVHETSGIGSFWAQVSPDGAQAVYRVLGKQIGQFLVSTNGGAPRMIAAMDKFSLASDWSPDGKRIVGECTPRGGICELDPANGVTRQIAANPKGGELLYPSWSWDAKWLVFMRRDQGRTVIWTASVRNDTLGPESEWVRISPESGFAARPRFAADGKSIFYLLDQHGARALVRHELNPGPSGRSTGEPKSLAHLQVVPVEILYSVGSPNSTVAVSRDRVFFNTVEVRGNIWMTSMH